MSVEATYYVTRQVWGSSTTILKQDDREIEKTNYYSDWSYILMIKGILYLSLALIVLTTEIRIGFIHHAQYLLSLIWFIDGVKHIYYSKIKK